MIYHFIVNPRARSGLGEMLWKQLEPELCRKRIDYQIHLTTKKKDAGKIASKITEDGQEHMFVVLGGDGTLNEVLSGIKSLEKVTLGYIPIGSSNDFARGTGIPGEKYFLKLKAFRRIATRYDKLAATYLGFICIASILIWLK